jgi:hypothetical protein
MASIQITCTGTRRIRELDPTGQATTLYVGDQNDTGDTNRGITKASFSGLQNGSIINSVTLDLYLNDVSKASNNRLLRVFRIKQVMTTSVTWNKYDGTNNWQVAGGTGANDIEAVDSGSLTFHTTDTTGQYYSISLTTADISAMFLGSYTNNGFLLKMDTETADQYRFDGEGEAHPPRLTIDYTLLSGQKKYSQPLGFIEF